MDPVAQARLAEMRAPLERLTPVTDAMLRDPSPSDWLMWRRTYNGWGHSPLTQINRENVKNLTVAWTWGMNSTGDHRVHAARARRDPVPVELRREDSGARRQERQPALGVHPPGARRASSARLLPDQAGARHRRQQADFSDGRHAHHRARRQDWPAGLGRLDRYREHPRACGWLVHSASTTAARWSSTARSSWAPAAARLAARPGPSAASSLGTTWKPARNCGDSTRSHSPASRAATPGTTCPQTGGGEHPSGRRRATTPN